MDPAEETYRSDEIKVVLADPSGPGPASPGLEERDTVKTVVTVSGDPQAAAQLEESVRRRLLENMQVRGESSARQNPIRRLREPVSALQAQKDAGECCIEIPVITFDSPEEEEVSVREEGDEGSEDSSTLRQTSGPSEEFHLCRETASSECSAGPQLPDAGGSDADEADAPQPGLDCHAFLRLPPSVARCGPGGRTHIRGLSMDSGKDAVLLSDHSHHSVSGGFCLPPSNPPHQTFEPVLRPP